MIVGARLEPSVDHRYQYNQYMTLDDDQLKKKKKKHVSASSERGISMINFFNASKTAREHELSSRSQIFEEK